MKRRIAGVGLLVVAAGYVALVMWAARECEKLGWCFAEGDLF